jgi:Homeodomain-like domain
VNGSPCGLRCPGNTAIRHGQRLSKETAVPCPASVRRIGAHYDLFFAVFSRWKKRFLDERLNGLVESRHPGHKPKVITPELQARVLEATRRKPQRWFDALVGPQTRSRVAHQ